MKFVGDFQFQGDHFTTGTSDEAKQNIVLIDYGGFEVFIQ